MSRRFDARMLADLAFLVGASASMYYVLSYFFDKSGGPAVSQESKKRADKSLKRLQVANPDALKYLDQYETALLANVVGPSDIKTGFADIGGLEDIIEELSEAVLYPLMRPDLFAAYSKLLQAPKGVLLYGPPGCGKTLLAKALAKESGANFLNIKMSTVLDKWFGESNKIVAAIFSLATKLGPCIVFIDEIDSFLRERASTDHEATAMLKGEFMTLWDGLTTDGRVMVLGATNRPNDIDKAILRRMTKKFPVSLPSPAQRLKILKVILSDALVADSFDYAAIINRTEGMSGSDLQELCRDALMRPMRENLRANIKLQADEPVALRPLQTTDFFVSTAAAERTAYNIVPELD